MFVDRIAHPSSKGRIVVALIVSAAAMAFSISSVGYLDDVRIPVSDTTADWLTTKAAVSGGNPYVDPHAISTSLGVPYVFKRPAEGQTVVHFRPPGAFIVLSPMLLLTPRQAYLASIVGSMLLALLLAVLMAPILGIRVESSLLGAPFFMLTSPVIGTFEWGSQSIVVAALIIWAWVRLSRGDAVSAGLALGVASALKLFPLVLLLPLVTGRRHRASLSCAITFALLQTAGLLLTGAGVANTAEGLRLASSSWGPYESNTSLAGIFSHAGIEWPLAVLSAFAIGVAALGFLWKLAADFDQRFTGALAISIFISPLAWGHYDVVLIPVALWLFSRRLGSRVVWIALAVWAIASLMEWIILLAIAGAPIPGLARAVMMFSGRVALFVGLSFAAWHGGAAKERSTISRQQQGLTSASPLES